jgi:hypothetical protein
VGDENFT